MVAAAPEATAIVYLTEQVSSVGASFIENVTKARPRFAVNRPKSDKALLTPVALASGYPLRRLTDLPSTLAVDSDSPAAMYCAWADCETVRRCSLNETIAAARALCANRVNRGTAKATTIPNRVMQTTASTSENPLSFRRAVCKMDRIRKPSAANLCA
jgi:hypothetical protein